MLLLFIDFKLLINFIVETKRKICLQIFWHTKEDTFLYDRV